MMWLKRRSTTFWFSLSALFLLSFRVNLSYAADASTSEETVLRASEVGVLTVSVPHSVSPATRAVLTTARREPLVARLDRRNRCIFPAVPPGSYLLEIWSGDYGFESARVDVGGQERAAESASGEQVQSARGGKTFTLLMLLARLANANMDEVRIEAWQTFPGHAWSNKGEKLGFGKGSLEISARSIGPKQYFEQRQGFNVMSLLSNPMILIGIVGVGMMVGMPKLLENMDPETRAEFEEQQRKNPLAGGMANGGNPLGNFDMAAWMAGSNAKPDAVTNTRGGVTGSEPAAGKARKRG